MQARWASAARKDQEAQVALLHAAEEDALERKRAMAMELAERNRRVCSQDLLHARYFPLCLLNSIVALPAKACLVANLIVATLRAWHALEVQDGF